MRIQRLGGELTSAAMRELGDGSIVKACYYFVASPGYCGNSISKRSEQREGVCECVSVVKLYCFIWLTL